ncbi:hypothetical protein [Actinoplanes sichuanensis]|uniref:Uncharacterized protein n=1 Tax=Actinoplanes sichuanensis TaxID=512349 RepID=A0ABW4A6Y8_9ACTN|nr:hypothetical protein [Actinoplanes sichuanensis]
MSRSWRYVAGWLAVTVTAVTVSWFGVRLGVAPALTDEPPVAIDVNRRYTEIRFGLAETEPPPSPSLSPRPSITPSKARPSRTPTRTPTTKPPASPSPTPSAEPSVVDRRPRYRVSADGGSIIVAYSSTRVDIVDADPLTGYTATGARRSDTVVVARLSGPGHTSVITAYWSGGPAAQVIEEYGS